MFALGTFAQRDSLTLVNARWETHMIAGGIVWKHFSASFNLTRHPRSAVVVTTSGKVLLITVEGRHENGAGMSLFELRNILKWLSASEAINLDGGGSTTLWISGQPGSGVVNYPIDTKKWDHTGERKVANVLILRRNKS